MPNGALSFGTSSWTRQARAATRKEECAQSFKGSCTLNADVRKTGHRSKVRMCLAQADIPKRLMEVRCDLPDFIRRMLAAERRSGNQIFAHRQSPDDDGFETNRSDEARRDIDSVGVIAGDRNSDESPLPVRVPVDKSLRVRTTDRFDMPLNQGSARA
jgi:hypothetical protein